MSLIGCDMTADPLLGEISTYKTKLAFAGMRPGKPLILPQND